MASSEVVRRLTAERDELARARWDMRTKLVTRFIDSVLGTPINVSSPSELLSYLEDGTILCKVVRTIASHLEVSVHPPTPLGKMRQQLQNLNTFLSACRTIGVPEDDLFSPQDVIQGRYQPVVQCILALEREVRPSLPDTPLHKRHAISRVAAFSSPPPATTPHRAVTRTRGSPPSGASSAGQPTPAPGSSFKNPSHGFPSAYRRPQNAGLKDLIASRPDAAVVSGATASAAGASPARDSPSAQPLSPLATRLDMSQAASGSTSKLSPSASDPSEQILRHHAEQQAQQQQHAGEDMADELRKMRSEYHEMNRANRDLLSAVHALMARNHEIGTPQRNHVAALAAAASHGAPAAATDGHAAEPSAGGEGGSEEVRGPEVAETEAAEAHPTAAGSSVRTLASRVAQSLRKTLQLTPTQGTPPPHASGRAQGTPTAGAAAASGGETVPSEAVLEAAKSAQAEAERARVEAMREAEQLRARLAEMEAGGGAAQAAQLRVRHQQLVQCVREGVDTAREAQIQARDAVRQAIAAAKEEMQRTSATLASAVEEAERRRKDMEALYVQETSRRRRVHNELQELRGNIRVFCRVRPLMKTGSGAEETTESAIQCAKDERLTITAPAAGQNMTGASRTTRKSFEFDHVFGPTSTQDKVFEEVCPLVTSAMDGFHVCCFAYGQTGSGKTFTMEGTRASRGLHHRALSEMFRLAHERRSTHRYAITVSMVEIYNEDARDLLASLKSRSVKPHHQQEQQAGAEEGDDDSGTRRPRTRRQKQQQQQQQQQQQPTSSKGAHSLEVRRGPEGMHMPEAVEVSVSNVEEVEGVMAAGQRARATGATNANEHSSRSHSLLFIHLRATDPSTGAATMGKLVLVDLAGSERVGRTEATGARLKEAQHINKSLSALGDVIASLKSKQRHVPFRNSKLTYLLQDSLGHDNKALMLVQVAPEPSNAQESLCSLQFASRVRCVELGRAKTHGNNAEAMERLRDAAKQAKQAASEAGQRAEEAEQRASRAEAEKSAADARVMASSEAANEASRRASEAEKKRDEAARSHKEMASLLSEAQGEMERLRKEVAAAKEEAEASRAAAERAKTAGEATGQHSADLDKLRSALREVQEDRDTQVMVLEEQLEGMRTVHEDERSRLEDERDRLEQKLSEAEARLCADSSSSNAVSSSGEAEEEQAALREALEAEQRQRQGAESELERLRAAHKALEADLRRAQATAAHESKAARRAKHAAEAAEAAAARSATPASTGHTGGPSSSRVPRSARKQVRWATQDEGGDENVQDYANVGGGAGVLGAIPEEDDDGCDTLWDESDGEDGDRIFSAPIPGHATPAAPRSVLKKTPRGARPPRPQSSAVAGSARQARHTQLPPARPRRGSTAHATPLKRGAHGASVKRTGLGMPARAQRNGTRASKRQSIGLGTPEVTKEKGLNKGGWRF